MLPITLIAKKHWESSGSSGKEVSPIVSPSTFRDMTHSKFGKDLGVPKVVKTFELVDIPVMIHTQGRRPSTTTFRTIRSTYHVLREIYGESPHETISVYLREDGRSKCLPEKRAVSVEDINSGFSAGDRIVVFRCSEMHRTLVHEMLHVWKVHGKDSKKHQKFSRSRLGAPENCLLTESFVEAITWLIFGGYCPKSMDPMHPLSQARGYLNVRDDGKTNGWAYFVGKAYLLVEGGKVFHQAFFPGGRGARLITDRSFDVLVNIMLSAHRSLELKPSKSRLPPVLCNCSLGSPYESA